MQGGGFDQGSFLTLFFVQQVLRLEMFWSHFQNLCRSDYFVDLRLLGAFFEQLKNDNFSSLSLQVQKYNFWCFIDLSS